jgi:hypothetical protein
MEQEARTFKAEKEYYERQGIDPNEPITLGEVEEVDMRKDDNV